MAPKAKPAAAAPAAPKAKADAKPKGKAKAKAEKKEEDEGPKVEMPNREEYDAAIAKIAAQIEGYTTEKGELDKKISECSGGRDENKTKRDELFAQIAEFNAEIKRLMDAKEENKSTMDEKRKEGADMRQQLNKMKKSIGYTSESDIDDRIATIEFKLWTDTLTLREEKEYLKEIQELKRNRPKLSQVERMDHELQNRDMGMHLKESISSINERLTQFYEGKNKVKEQLKELDEGRKEKMGDTNKWREKRDEITKKIKDCITERNAIRDDFREKERAFNQWKADQRKARQEKQQQEWLARKAEQDKYERQKRADKLDVQPYVKEITLIEQTICWCRGLIKEKGGAKVEEKKEIAHNNPEGTEVLLKKEDRDEFYFVPTSGKKKGKSKKKENDSAKPIKHNAQTFQDFDELKLNAPVTTDDIPATLEKLEAQLESYQEKVAQWEKDRDEKKQRILAGEDEVEEKEEKEEELEEKEDGAEKITVEEGGDE